MDKRDREFIKIEKVLKRKGYFLNPDSKKDYDGTYMLFWKGEKETKEYFEIKFYLWK